MTPSSAIEERRAQAADSDSIRPLVIDVPEAELTEMRRRIDATRWPERETVPDDSQGVPSSLMQELARYWATEYNWRACEKKLNALPQFITEIDGLDIHFIHVRSKHKNALPLIVTHGWPGSTIEQLKIIDPLTNPTAYGADAADAFDVVVPSIPGFGFSGKPTSTGWDPSRIARAWAVLMKRLGYSRFVASGGDFGAVITDVMATQTPPGLVAMHTNMPGAVPNDISNLIVSGGAPPSGLSSEEMATFNKLRHFFATGVYYAFEMGTRPQTLYGIADSPVGLAAWLIDHGDGDAQPAAAIAAAARRPSKGQPADVLTRDDVLDNITFYWLTNTGISSARLYWENKSGFFNTRGVSIPVGVSVFPGELYQIPRSWAERAYPKLIHYNKVDKGGHFAAWEQPQILTAEIRATFKSFR
jgi:pimeloyl-ACP methyl ester carboxylesterase